MYTCFNDIALCIDKWCNKISCQRLHGPKTQITYRIRQTRKYAMQYVQLDIILHLITYMKCQKSDIWQKVVMILIQELWILIYLVHVVLNMWREQILRDGHMCAQLSFSKYQYSKTCWIRMFCIPACCQIRRNYSVPWHFLTILCLKYVVQSGSCLFC